MWPHVSKKRKSNSAPSAPELHTVKTSLPRTLAKPNLISQLSNGGLLRKNFDATVDLEKSVGCVLLWIRIFRVYSLVEALSDARRSVQWVLREWDSYKSISLVSSQIIQHYITNSNLDTYILPNASLYHSSSRRPRIIRGAGCFGRSCDHPCQQMFIVGAPYPR